MPSNEKTNACWPLGIRVWVQRQISLIMTMKNIIHEIIYDEQNYTSLDTKIQKSIIPLLDDTSNKNNKNVLLI
jgi:ABC-type dipeptide/oligopeptide/nickel transport system ATPase component